MAKARNAGFYVEVKGIDDTITKINIFKTKSLQEAKLIIKDTANDVRKTAKANAPKFSGTYSAKESARSKPGDTKASIRVKTYDNGLHARVKPSLPKGWKAHFLEYGTTKMRARPFMGPAEEAARPKYNNRIKALVNKEETI